MQPLSRQQRLRAWPSLVDDAPDSADRPGSPIHNVQFFTSCAARSRLAAWQKYRTERHKKRNRPPTRPTTCFTSSTCGVRPDSCPPGAPRQPLGQRFRHAAHPLFGQPRRDARPNAERLCVAGDWPRRLHARTGPSSDRPIRHTNKRCCSHHCQDPGARVAAASERRAHHLGLTASSATTATCNLRWFTCNYFIMV